MVKNYLLNERKIIIYFCGFYYIYFISDVIIIIILCVKVCCGVMCFIFIVMFIYLNCVFVLGIIICV